MAFLAIFSLLCVLAATQWIADALISLLPAHGSSPWFKLLLVQDLLILGWALSLDPGDFGDALRHAAALTFSVRWFCLLKRLKAD